MTDLQTSDYHSNETFLPIFSSGSSPKATDEEASFREMGQETSTGDPLPKKISKKKPLQPEVQASTQSSLSSDEYSFSSTWAQWERIKKLSRETTKITLLGKEPDLIKARQMLVIKMMSESLSVQEKTDLDYINWQLNKIEDAKYGESLDALQKIVEVHETVSREVHDTVSAIKAIAASANRKTKWKTR